MGILYLSKAALWLIGILLIAAPFLSSKVSKSEKPTSKKSIILCFLIGLFTIGASFGWFYVPEKHSGHVTRKMGDPLKSGHLIARTSMGERGQQSELLPPGFGYDIGYPWVVSIDYVKDFVVPAGKFAVLEAVDGTMPKNIVADAWASDIDEKKMLRDFEYFQANGGERGIQRYIVKTGIYRINRFQWKNIKTYKLTEIRANEVLVIESKYGEAPAFTQTSDDEILSVPLVKDRSFRGIVDKAFPSGYYAIHPHTEQAHPVSIVLETYIYGGGYHYDTMDLVIDPENDKLVTVKGEGDIPSQKDGSAFEAKTKDNHTVRFDVRVLGQIEPVQAPRFIGTIRDPQVLDDKVIEPFTRNILSNITLEYEALELKDKKKEIGQRVSKLLRDRTIKTGFRTKTVEITNIDIPPIVLIPKKIESASKALKDALIEKEKSVQQAIKVRNMQDQADNQEELAKATVSNAAADQKASSITKLSAANKTKANDEADAAAYRIQTKTAAEEERIIKMAKAYGALAKEVGKEAAASIMLQETINQAAEKYQMPEVLSIGGGGSADIIAPHMISKAIRQANQQAISGK